MSGCIWENTKRISACKRQMYKIALKINNVYCCFCVIT